MAANRNQFYELHFYYGMHLHYQCGDFELALQHYMLALAIEDNWAITYFHISRVLLDIDRQNETNSNHNTALFFLKKAYRLNSKIPVIASRYEHNKQTIRAILKREEKVTSVLLPTPFLFHALYNESRFQLFLLGRLFCSTDYFFVVCRNDRSRKGVVIFSCCWFSLLSCVWCEVFVFCFVCYFFIEL